MYCFDVGGAVSLLQTFWTFHTSKYTYCNLKVGLNIYKRLFLIFVVEYNFTESQKLLTKKLSQKIRFLKKTKWCRVRLEPYQPQGHQNMLKYKTFKPIIYKFQVKVIKLLKSMNKYELWMRSVRTKNVERFTILRVILAQGPC